MVFFTNRCGPFLVKAYTVSFLMSTTYWVPLKWTIDMGLQGICVDNLGSQALANRLFHLNLNFYLYMRKPMFFNYTCPNCSKDVLSFAN